MMNATINNQLIYHPKIDAKLSFYCAKNLSLWRERWYIFRFYYKSTTPAYKKAT